MSEPRRIEGLPANTGTYRKRVHVLRSSATRVGKWKQDAGCKPCDASRVGPIRRRKAASSEVSGGSVRGRKGGVRRVALYSASLTNRSGAELSFWTSFLAGFRVEIGAV